MARNPMPLPPPEVLFRELTAGQAEWRQAFMARFFTREDGPMAIGTGDVVRLKSGGPPMTAASSEAHTGAIRWNCHWFAKDATGTFGQLTQGQFFEYELVEAQAATDKSAQVPMSHVQSAHEEAKKR